MSDPDVHWWCKLFDGWFTTDAVSGYGGGGGDRWGSGSGGGGGDRWGSGGGGGFGFGYGFGSGYGQGFSRGRRTYT